MDVQRRTLGWGPNYDCEKRMEEDGVSEVRMTSLFGWRKGRYQVQRRFLKRPSRRCCLFIGGCSHSSKVYSAGYPDVSDLFVKPQP